MVEDSNQQVQGHIHRHKVGMVMARTAVSTSLQSHAATHKPVCFHRFSINSIKGHSEAQQVFVHW